MTRQIDYSLSSELVAELGMRRRHLSDRVGKRIA